MEPTHERAPDGVDGREEQRLVRAKHHQAFLDDVQCNEAQARRSCAQHVHAPQDDLPHARDNCHAHPSVLRDRRAIDRTDLIRRLQVRQRRRVRVSLGKNTQCYSQRTGAQRNQLTQCTSLAGGMTLRVSSPHQSRRHAAMVCRRPRKTASASSPQPSRRSMTCSHDSPRECTLGHHEGTRIWQVANRTSGQPSG